MTQKLSKVQFFKNSNVTPQDVELGGTDQDFVGGELDPTHIDQIVEGFETQKNQLFRDKLSKMGGDLNHNLIKLNYERKLTKKVKEE